MNSEVTTNTSVHKDLDEDQTSYSVGGNDISTRLDFASIDNKTQEEFDSTANETNGMSDTNDPLAPTPLHTMINKPALIDHITLSYLTSLFSKQNEVSMETSLACDCGTRTNGTRNIQAQDQTLDNNKNTILATTILGSSCQPSLCTSITMTPLSMRVPNVVSQPCQLFNGMVGFDPRTLQTPRTLSPILNTATKSVQKEGQAALKVLPRQGGIVFNPLQNDVLCGRGGRINSYIGNVRFRNAVAQCQSEYLNPDIPKSKKGQVAAKIVHYIRGIGGRFLTENPIDGVWYEIGDAKAIRKTCQALREYGPNIRCQVSARNKRTVISSQDVDKMTVSSPKNDASVSGQICSEYTDLNRKSITRSNNYLCSLRSTKQRNMQQIDLDKMKMGDISTRATIPTDSNRHGMKLTNTPAAVCTDNKEVNRRLSERLESVFGQVFHLPNSTSTGPNISRNDDNIKVVPPAPSRRFSVESCRNLSDSSIGTFS